MPNIRYCTPYSLTKNLADAYNDEMERAKPGEYVAFVDADTEWLDPYFGSKIHDIVNQHPNSFFTCYTNRTNCKWQRRNEVLNNDISEHRSYAHYIWLNNKDKVLDCTSSQLWSGHLMICPKDKWTPIKKRGLLGIDNEIHKMAKKDSKVL